jgi:predicted MFS family arabinose efflux permease
VSALLAGALVFVCAAAVLMLEILSLRLVAPYAGITLEVSTAVIGFSLGAIAVGAWLGGLAADRWDPRKLLGPGPTWPRSRATPRSSATTTPPSTS